MAPQILLFPSYAYLSAAAPSSSPKWTILVRGCFLTPNPESRRKSLIFAFGKRFLLDSSDANETWNERSALFFATAHANYPLSIRILGLLPMSDNTSPSQPPSQESKEETELEILKNDHATTTLPTGHFTARIDMSETSLNELRTAFPNHNRNKLLVLVTDPNNVATPPATQTIQIISPMGLSLISDIDDTIKDTKLQLGTKAVLANSLSKPPVEVAGMSCIYNYFLTQHPAMTFHYVSASPFQLFPMLHQFLHSCQFPSGTMNLRNWKDRSTLWESSGNYKLKIIIEIFRHFPSRQFVLIGDSVQQDPEIYAHLARLFPTQVLKIFIRDLTRIPSVVNAAAPSDGVDPDADGISSNATIMAAKTLAIKASGSVWRGLNLTKNLVVGKAREYMSSSSSSEPSENATIAHPNPISTTAALAKEMPPALSDDSKVFVKAPASIPVSPQGPSPAFTEFKSNSPHFATLFSDPLQETTPVAPKSPKPMPSDLDPTSDSIPIQEDLLSEVLLTDADGPIPVIPENFAGLISEPPNQASFSTAASSTSMFQRSGILRRPRDVFKGLDPKIWRVYRVPEEIVLHSLVVEDERSTQING